MDLHTESVVRVISAASVVVTLANLDVEHLCVSSSAKNNVT